VNKKIDTLERAHEKLESLMEQKNKALPSEFNRQRFLQNVFTVLKDTDRVGKANPQDLAREILKGALLGLDFFRGECYIIMYGSRPNFQTDYKGERKIARKYSLKPIRNMYAKVVRHGDELEIIDNDAKTHIRFEPIPMSTKEIKGAFAKVIFQDGSLLYESMNIDQLKSVAENFGNTNTKAYKYTAGEMYKKIVLRRLLKSVEVDFESVEQERLWQDSSDMEFQDNQNEV